MERELLEATALSDAFNILAVLTQYPTREVAEGIAAGALGDDMVAIARELGLEEGALRAACKREHGADPEELLGRMRVAYTALFNHPESPAVPLYEEQYLFDRREAPGALEGKDLRSVCVSDEPKAARRGSRKGRCDVMADARPRLFVNPASLDALREYRAAGVTPENERKLPADAMPVEMEFCALLHLRLSQALRAGDDQGQRGARAAIDEFSHLHLAKWMRGFYDDCALAAPCPTYRAMGMFGAAIAERMLVGQAAACA